MSGDYTIWVGVLGTISTIGFSFLAYDKGKKKDCKDDGKSAGVLMSDIGYIKAGVDDLKRKQETTEDRHYALAERVTKVEESTKSAHHRIDKLEAPAIDLTKLMKGEKDSV
jgi:hypothetical protein